MSPLRRLRTAAQRSRLHRAAMLVLAAMAAFALFAELLAGDAPVVAIGHGHVRVLAALTERTTYAAMSRAQIDATHAGDLALWPLVRQSPERADQPFQPPTLRHPLGTDAGGLDVFANVIYGARAGLGPALVALVVALIAGGLAGGLAGTVGGIWDELVARPVELLQALPSVVVVTLAMAADPSRSALTLAVTIALLRAADVARVVRVTALRLANHDAVRSARALGASPLRILVRHVWPECEDIAFTSALAALPSLVSLEAAVAFLGIGIPSSWGTMIARGVGVGGSWWSAGCAALALIVTVVAATLIADGLSEASSPGARVLRAPDARSDRARGGASTETS